LKETYLSNSVSPFIGANWAEQLIMRTMPEASWKSALEQVRVTMLGKARALRLRGLLRPPLNKQEFLRIEGGKLGQSDVCHIVGSGWSLVDSMSAVRSGDYVVGYNLAALSGMNFDAYYSERANRRVPGINSFYREMLGLAKVRNPYVKNLYERGASPEVINFHIKDGAIPLKTFNVGGYFKRGEERALANYLLDGGGPFFLQYRSSLMLLIVIYAKLGFRRILLHGHDLSGPYYFDVGEFELAKRLNPRHHGILPSDIPSLDEGHIINQAFAKESRLTDMLPVFAHVLLERGVALCAASAKSPIARLIPVLGDSEASSTAALGASS
jgi:hypothetical protein